MSVFKPAVIVSLISALMAFVVAPSSSWAVAGLRALMVFSGLFVWSYIAFYFISRILPSGKSSFAKPISEMETARDGRFVDMEKQSIDQAKLHELLR